MKMWFGLAACLFTVGCVTLDVQPMDEVVRPARDSDLVTVLLEKPDQPYIVIAVIESKTETVFDNFEDLRDAMVTEAAKLGGEALILGAETTDSEFIMTGTAMIQSDHRKLTCEVIVFERDGRSGVNDA